MMKLNLHCQSCGAVSPFQHPSITSIEKLEGVSLDCPSCGEAIRFDANVPITVSMISVKDSMVRTLEAMGIQVDPKKIGYIQF